VRENLRTIGLTLFSASELRTWSNVSNKPCNLRNNVAYVRTEQACDGIRACLTSFSAEVNAIKNIKFLSSVSNVVTFVQSPSSRQT